LKRKAAVDPWQCFDNFRINHHAKREIALVNREGKVAANLKVEYLAENKFNVYEAGENDALVPIIMGAKVEEKEEGCLHVSCDAHQFKIEYIHDEVN